MRVFLIVLSSLFLMQESLFPCANTSYSIKEERQITNELVYIIYGEFAHHGKAFWKAEVKRNKAILSRNPQAYESRNDLAVAYIKLAMWDQALAEFSIIQRQKPDLYKTLSNLGVLYKKMGLYKMAYKHLKKALRIKKEGHMGLGNYYLQMAQWLSKKADLPNGEKMKVNFLGIPYAKGPKAYRNNKRISKKYIITLIKNDRHFADALFVLGDILFYELEYQLAIRAYYRAYQLNKHPYATERMKKAYNRLSRKLQEYPRRITNSVVYTKGNTLFKDESDKARRWVEAFEETEARLTNSHSRPSFKLVKRAMKKRGLKHQVIHGKSLMRIISTYNIKSLIK